MPHQPLAFSCFDRTSELETWSLVLFGNIQEKQVRGLRFISFISKCFEYLFTYIKMKHIIFKQT